MVRAEILSPWVNVLEADAWMSKPKIMVSYPLEYTGEGAESISVPYHPDNVIPTPNMATVIIEYSDAKFALIEADSDYFIVWSEQI